jgi:hypothetical protein
MEQLTMHLERATGGTESTFLTADEWRMKTRNAPTWWLEQAKRDTRRPAASASAPASNRPVPARRVAGWISGCCTPGVSTPGFASADGEHLPEQFTPKAIEQVVRELNTGRQKPSLTWGHDGPVLASGVLDLTFRCSALLGLEFTARLADSEFNRKVIEAAGGDGLGVSIGFRSVKQWIVEREGAGRVRVVDEMKLDHVAILPPDRKMNPVYSGARCFGSPGEYLTCPHQLRAKAEQFAYRLVKQQAGVRE